MAQTEKEYVTLDDVAKEVGIKKGSLYYYLRELGIKTHKFPLNKHAHIARKDMEFIREAKDSPWKINQLKELRQVVEEDTQGASEPRTCGVETRHKKKIPVSELVY